ncbi:MAG: NYN domain-containing protein [Hyphomicrobiaceae bacterium]
MMRESQGGILSAVFVDYDNIYLSLKRKNEEAAKRFAKDAGRWLAAIQSGAIVKEAPHGMPPARRRMVMNRCYGNPVPRRNQSDNSTDMNSFPFVRHHFLRAGFEVIDCPPLTAQLKNSSDIKMVMDLRDFLTHATHFEEFIILSSDADFTPVLHRLRAHNRRTVIYANDNTVDPYKAIADAEVREADLIALLLDVMASADATRDIAAETTLAIATEEHPPKAAIASQHKSPKISEHSVQAPDITAKIMEIVVAAVRSAPAPIPVLSVEALVIEQMGDAEIIASNWAGNGSIEALLRTTLPADIAISKGGAPVLYDLRRAQRREPAQAAARPAQTAMPLRAVPSPARLPEAEAAPSTPPPRAPAIAPAQASSVQPPIAPTQPVPQQQARTAPQSAPATEIPRSLEGDRPVGVSRGNLPEARATDTEADIEARSARALQQSISKIHGASKAPPLSPPDYRALFEELAIEITENELQGVQTISNVVARLAGRGVDIRREDVRFVLDVISDSDPWFENGASANVFAGRFHNFVVQSCRSRGIELTSSELDLIQTWFASGSTTVRPIPRVPASQSEAVTGYDAQATAEPVANAGSTQWWDDDGRISDGYASSEPMPRVLRPQPRA